MGSKKLCIVCNNRWAEVPDREQMGRPIKRVCLPCHQGRLRSDARPIIAAANLARLSAAVVEAAVDLRVAVAAYDDALEQGLMPDDVRHRRAVAWAARESLNRCTDALIAARKEASRG